MSGQKNPWASARPPTKAQAKELYDMVKEARAASGLSTAEVLDKAGFNKAQIANAVRQLSKLE
jgi:hypothetical protein